MGLSLTDPSEKVRAAVYYLVEILNLSGNVDHCELFFPHIYAREHPVQVLVVHERLGV
jgi:hypothetical protein